MSEFGVKIKNYQAASVYEYNNGLRNRMDTENAMLVNSLFKDFLDENGLTVKGESTRDIICMLFDYGTKDYHKTISKIDSLEQTESVVRLKEQIEKNADKCIKYTKEELRTMYYVNGVDIKYPNYNKKGEIISTDVIHYKMLYRTPGKAKKGTCMFIREELYDKAHKFLYMGYELPEKNAPIVEIGAYASLITSSIVGRIQIKPEEILIVDDIKNSITTDVITVYTDDSGMCRAKKVSNYDIPSESFDGQALIDSSIFPSWGDGYVLLRHHMTKCAAFCTNIELFMRDQFGDNYETATVKDMWGRDVRVKDVKLITTNNAIKWLKFGITFDYWTEWVRKNNCMFGVVKTSHPSKLGDVQRMSYQMVNALSNDIMDSVCEKSVKYINKLKYDDDVFLDYLKRNSNFSNDYEVLVALVEHNPDFTRSSYYRSRKYEIIKAYVLDFKSGRCIQNADNLTIVGSPYAMLLHSIGLSPYDDPTFRVEDGCIQCWTNRFKNLEYLAEFRNPFNSRNNLGYIHNVHHPYFDKYFNLGKLCIAVNTINTDWQARNNGADQDSDSVYTTNQYAIVRHAKYCYKNYPTVVNEIKPEKNIYDYSLESYAKIDNSLTAAQLAIGQSSNLAQLCLTYSHNFDDKKYYDYVCILAVLAQVAIDNAKRKYAVSLETEIPRIQNDLDIKENKLPMFWKITKKDKRKCRSDEERKKRQKENQEKIKDNINKDLTCPMNYLYQLNLDKVRNMSPTLSMDYFFVNHPLEKNNIRKSKKVEELIEKYSLELYNYTIDHDGENWKEDHGDLLLRADFDELIRDIKSTYISKNYVGLMSWLINRAFVITPGAKRKADETSSNTDKNKALLLKVLYMVNKDVFLECFKKVCI